MYINILLNFSSSLCPGSAVKFRINYKLQTCFYMTLQRACLILMGIWPAFPVIAFHQWIQLRFVLRYSELDIKIPS